MEAIRTTPYIDKYAADYHFQYFGEIFSCFDIKGKTVLEIGPDQRYIVSRMFLENGARQVYPYSVGSGWNIFENMPEKITPVFCDFNIADIAPASVDLVVGIALLEHLTDIDKTFGKIHSILKPDGGVFLQGGPLWACPYGHHLWAEASVLYSFNGKNPLPHYSHLSLDSNGMRRLLQSSGMLNEPEDLEKIIEAVYDYNPLVTSNRQTPAVMERVFHKYFDGHSKRTKNPIPESVYSRKARLFYSEEDLSTSSVCLYGKKKIMPDIDRKERISVIVPCYNVEPYINECLESIFSQTYPDLEIILVDDKSTDGTLKALKAHADDPRVNIIAHDYNLGLGPARNSGVKAATGKWIFFLDSDDVLASEHVLEDLEREAKSHDVGVVISCFETFFENGKIIPTGRTSYREAIAHEIPGLPAFLGAYCFPSIVNIPMHAWGMLINTKLLVKDSHPFPAGVHEDMPVIPFLYLQAGKIYYSAIKAVRYRGREKSLSHNRWGKENCINTAHILQLVRRKSRTFNMERFLPQIASMLLGHHLYKAKVNGIDKKAIPHLLRTILIHLEYIPSKKYKSVIDSINSLLDVLKQNLDSGSFREVESFFYGNATIQKLLSPVEEGNNVPRAPLPDARHDANCLSESVISHPEFEKKSPENFESPSPVGNESSNLGTTVVCDRDDGYGTLAAGKKIIEFLNANSTYNRMLVYEFDKNIYSEHSDSYIIENWEAFLDNSQYYTANLMEIVKVGENVCKYQEKRPIKTLLINCDLGLIAIDTIAREFFPHLIHGLSKIILINYNNYSNPFIHVLVELLKEKFVPDSEIAGLGTFVLNCREKISPEEISYIFGEDPNGNEKNCKWFFGDYSRNDILLYKRHLAMDLPINQGILNLARSKYASLCDREEISVSLYHETLEIYPELKTFKHFQIRTK